MKAEFSKDQYSPVLVFKTDTRDKLYNTFILFPASDSASLIAMKAYIDAVKDEKDLSPNYINNLIKEYERIKRYRDQLNEFSSWEDG